MTNLLQISRLFSLKNAAIQPFISSSLLLLFTLIISISIADLLLVSSTSSDHPNPHSVSKPSLSLSLFLFLPHQILTQSLLFFSLFFPKSGRIPNGSQPSIRFHGPPIGPRAQVRPSKGQIRSDPQASQRSQKPRQCLRRLRPKAQARELEAAPDLRRPGPDFLRSPLPACVPATVRP